MYQYVLLIAIPLIFSAGYKMYLKDNRIVLLGEKDKNPLIPIFFVLLFLLLALRNESVGTDLITYKHHFENYSNYSLSTVKIFSEEWLFKWLNIIIGKFTNDYQIYLAIVAVITVLPFAYIYCQDKSHGYLKMIIFVNMSTFVMMFSGLRQALALAFGMIAYNFVKKKKPVWFLVFCVLAMAVHHSGFMLFLMYPLYHIRLKKEHLVFVIPVVAFIFIFKNRIFTFLNEILSETTDKYGSEISETGAYMMLILFVLFALFAYFITDDSKMDAEAFGLRNFLVLAVVLQIFASLHPLSMRLNYYYIVFIPLALGRCFEFPKKEHESLTRLVEIILNVFFTFYFFYGIYNSYKTGISALDTVPYKFFWEM